MTVSRKSFLVSAMLAPVGAALAACGSSDSNGSGSSATPSGSTVAGTGAGSATVEDNYGSVEVALPVERVATTDNRTFEVLADWGAPVVAVPKPLVPSTVTAFKGEDIVDLGSHNEPDLEALVAAEPDLIIAGQRFSQFYEDMKSLNPDTPIIDLEPREGQPLDSELARQVTALGAVFGKEAEAETLVEGLNTSVSEAKAAYDGTSTVMAVNVSGGEIGYIAPSVGRTFGPVFDLLGLEPSLTVTGASSTHEGDDISVEAIAESNPDWILVLDRDGAVSADEEGYTPAQEVISGNAALQNVSAVSNGRIIYAPQDTYTNESIITYTEIFDLITEAFTSGKGNAQ
ncbi:MAG: ABC transporter substrate-binding protein [Actinomyces sp.]|uniref:siderophore ABC transporter substrate-binding protein n=1 Tax=Actinomyces sp. TaxID=29317 RepID=UPI0026DC838A|nr:ABC transporter substrate-binding protein [Actinomyces sp.]MDO4242899.1 ABC transporter substrate-binding protein [Actinomyces sp.]